MLKPLANLFNLLRKHMKFKLLIAALSFTPILVYAQTIPNMLGTWKGITNSTVIGTGAHHLLPNKKDTEIHVTHIPLTIVFDHQEGMNFWGTQSTASYKEVAIGALSSDLQGGVMVDSDGITYFKIVDPNTIQYCYAQMQKPKVASCAELKRK